MLFSVQQWKIIIVFGKQEIMEKKQLLEIKNIITKIKNSK